MVKIIEAGMPGACGLCSKEYAAGTRILKDPKTNKWVEADCYFPSHTRNNAYPKAHQTTEEGNLSPPTSKGVDALPAEVKAAADYAAMLLQAAKDAAHAAAPGWEEMSEYPYLIAVLVQTMHGRISGERIAAQEAEKLKVYGGKKW